MTRILLISYCFAPQNQIGAVRPTKLAKYLTRMGCDVTVICGTGMNPQLRDPTLARDIAELTDVRVMNEWNPLRRVRALLHRGGGAPSGAAAPADKRSLKARAMDAAYRYLRLKGDRSFERMAKRELKKLQGPYDVVLSSYGPASVHNVARLAKRSGIAKKWIADFRDEVELPFGWLKRYERGYLRMIQREADLKTAASEGFLQMMHFEGRMLSNGFDREDLPPADEAADETKRFRAVYCGQLNEGRRGVPARDVTPCLKALRALVDEGLLDRSELSLVYAGNQSGLFRRYAAAAGLEDCVSDFGQVSRERSLMLQQQADLLLMASVNTRSQYGILTGKLFEYLMMEKPIACCMQGDLAESAIKRMLARTGAGFCWEAANAAPDTPALADWLREIIYKWRQDLPALTAKNKEQIEMYGYPRLASTLLDWIRE